MPKEWKYIERTYTLSVYHGYTKRKCLDIDNFNYTERLLVSTDEDRSWTNTWNYTWENLSDFSPICEKKDVYYKSNALFYEARLIDYSKKDDFDIHPVRILRQIDCPNATFKLTVYNHILTRYDYTLKEIIEKEAAARVIQFLKQEGIQEQECQNLL